MKVRKITDRKDYDLYTTDVTYDYSIDDIISSGITDTQSIIDAVIRLYLPELDIKYKAPEFGCSAFSTGDTRGHVLTGRNYDFKNDTSAMLVHCRPTGGYESVATAALDNIGMNAPEDEKRAALANIAAPFICLDGLNEKGVSIAVLTLDSEPTFQHTGKLVIATTLAIRLVLDRAATTQEAVDILKQYDMMASSGRDYHFYINDASGDGRAVEYDCNSSTRELVDTPIRSITNFFAMYRDKVKPHQHNDPYGHGRERYDSIEAVLTEAGDSATEETAWQAVKASSQEPNEGDITSNTQWSIVYDNTKLTAGISLRRDWDNIIHYDLKAEIR